MLRLLFGTVDNGGFFIKNAIDTVQAGIGLGNLYAKVRQLDELHQDLVHVVHQCHHLALGQDTGIHQLTAGQHQCHHTQVDDDICHGIQQCGNAAHTHLHFGQQVIFRLELFLFRRLTVEGTHHPDTQQVFPGRLHYPVQLLLHIPVHGHGGQHDAEYHHSQQRNRNTEYQGCLHINGEGHDHGAEDNEGRPHKKTKCQIHAALDLVDV